VKKLKIDVEEMLDELGMNNVQRRGEEVYFSCPFEGHKLGDSTPSTSMNVNSTGFHCWGCGRSGNAISFLSELEGVSPVTALRWLRERFGERFIEPISVQEDIASMLSHQKGLDRKNLAPIPEQEQEMRAVDWGSVFLAEDRGETVPEALRYLPRRGFTADSLNKWEIGYDPVSSMLTIPYRTAEGELLGFKGRAWQPDAKVRYRVLGDRSDNDVYGFTTFEISRAVFGQHLRSTWSSRPRKGVVLSEGELNAIAVDHTGYASLGISGQFISEEQARIIRSLTDEVTLIFDEMKNALKAARMLERHITVKIAPDHPNDPADALDGEIETMIGDARSSLT